MKNPPHINEVTDNQKLEWLEPAFECFSSDIIQSGPNITGSEVLVVGPDS